MGDSDENETAEIQLELMRGTRSTQVAIPERPAELAVKTDEVRLTPLFVEFGIVEKIKSFDDGTTFNDNQHTMIPPLPKLVKTFNYTQGPIQSTMELRSPTPDQEPSLFSALLIAPKKIVNLSLSRKSSLSQTVQIIPESKPSLSEPNTNPDLKPSKSDGDIRIRNIDSPDTYVLEAYAQDRAKDDKLEALSTSSDADRFRTGFASSTLDTIPLVDIQSQKADSDSDNKQSSASGKEHLSTYQMSKIVQLTSKARIWQKKSTKHRNDDSDPTRKYERSWKQMIDVQISRSKTEIPFALQMDIYEETYPILLKTVEMYIAELGPRHHVSVAAIRRLREMARILRRACEY